MTARIVPGADITTQINIVTVDPELSDQVLEVLTSSTESHIRGLKGFISANFHRSKDRTKVINYAQWETTEDWLAMRSDAVGGAHIGEIHRLAKPDAHLYTVRETYTADGLGGPLEIGDPRAGAVLIIEFSTNPYDVEAVAQGLHELTESRIRRLPGFIGMGINVAEDGTRVVEYVQWASPEAAAQTRENAEIREVIEGIRARASVAIMPVDIAAQFRP